MPDIAADGTRRRKRALAPAFQAQPVLERLRIVGFGFGQQLLDLPFNLPQLLAGATVTDRTPMASAIG
jgi:hypothetical protein